MRPSLRSEHDRQEKKAKKTFFLSFPLSLTEEQTQTNGITFFFLQDSVGGGFFFGSSQVHFRKVIESFLIITAAAIRLNLVNWFSLLSRVSVIVVNDDPYSTTSLSCTNTIQPQPTITVKQKG